MKTRSIFFLAIAAALLVTACYGQNDQTVSRRSSDGTQEGSIRLSNDGMRGSVSSSSTGTRQARASSSLVIGPGTAQGSFAAEGDDEQVSDTLSVDPEEEEVNPEEAEEEEAVTVEEQTVKEEPEPKQKEAFEVPKLLEEEGEEEMEDEDEAAESLSGEALEEEEEGGEEGFSDEELEEDENEEDDEDDGGDDEDDDEDGFLERPYTLGGTRTVIYSSSSGSTKDAEKICLVGDDSEVQKYLDDGYEVTLVQATEEGQVQITTALEWPGVSSKNTITSSYIPKEIKERCDVTYEDLGLEDRPDGEASLSSSGSSFHFSSTSDSSGRASTSNIRNRVFGSLCNQPFFHNFAMFDECKQHGDIEDEDYYPWG